MYFDVIYNETVCKDRLQHKNGKINFQYNQTKSFLLIGAGIKLKNLATKNWIIMY
jgi:hypothetical protein